MDARDEAADELDAVSTGAAIELRITETKYLVTGEPTELTQRHGSETVTRTIQYDTLGRMVVNTEPSSSENGKAWRHGYNDGGDLVGTSDVRGCGVNFAYDAAGRLVSEDYSPCEPVNHRVYDAAPEVDYRYDLPDDDAVVVGGQIATLGRMTSVTDLASKAVSHWDMLGRVTHVAKKVASPSGSLATEQWFHKHVDFDGAGRPIRETTGATVNAGDGNASAVVATYTARGKVKQVRSAAILSLVLIATPNCRSSYPIPPEEVPSAVRRAHEGNLVIRDGERDIRVTSDHRAILALAGRRSCDARAEGCDFEFSGRLQDVEVIGNRLLLQRDACFTDLRIHSRQLLSASVRCGSRTIRIEIGEIANAATFCDGSTSDRRVSPIVPPTLDLDVGTCPDAVLGYTVCSGGHVVIAPEMVRVSGAEVVVTTLGCSSAAYVTLAEIHESAISLHAPPPDDRGKWSIGGDVAGPAGFVSVTGGVRWPLVTLELGVIPAASAMAGAWAGIRVRGGRVGPFAPFLGGFAHVSIVGGSSADSETEANPVVAASGPRGGVEFVFPSQRHVLSAEFDLVRTLGESDAYLYGLHGPWIPWGGVGFALLL